MAEVQEKHLELSAGGSRFAQFSVKFVTGVARAVPLESKPVRPVGVGPGKYDDAPAGWASETNADFLLGKPQVNHCAKPNGRQPKDGPHSEKVNCWAS